MPTVLLVRHGQGSFGSADYDVLSDRGHAQAEVVAATLARRIPRPVRVVSGSLARQRDTATPIAARAELTAAVDGRWDEYESEDILACHSTTAARVDRRAAPNAPAITSEAFQAAIEPALAAWVAAGADGPAAEPWTTFAARSEAALSDLLQSLGRGETAVACTSGGVIAALCVALLELPADRFVAFNRVMANGAITTVVRGRGGTTLVSLNEHGHLLDKDRSLLTYR